jgi:hypothetical protein
MLNAHPNDELFARVGNNFGPVIWNKNILIFLLSFFNYTKILVTLHEGATPNQEFMVHHSYLSIGHNV